MAKKGLCVWIFTSLTFVSVAHLVEAIYVLISGNAIRLLELYPFVGEKMNNVSPVVYLWVSAVASLVFWGITCAIAFQSPLEQFLTKVFVDAKKQSAIETKMVEDKCEILDAMFETLESSSETIANVKDIVCNVRTEMKAMQPLVTTVDMIRLELNDITREVEELEDNVKYSYVCPACGKPLLPEFKMCPYCGENSGLLRTPVITLTDQKQK